MNKKWKKIICILFICVFVMSRRDIILAEEPITIVVQETDVQENGNIIVEIHMKNVKNLGGMDFSLTYDSKKLSYVDSALQGIFAEGFGETNHIAKESMVKIVSIYQYAVEKDGTVATITFQPKTENSELPKLQVNDLVDASLEIKDIPFVVEYKNTDGMTTTEQGTEDNKNQETEAESGENTTEIVNGADTEVVGEDKTSKETQNSENTQGKEEQEGSGLNEQEETELLGGEDETIADGNTDSSLITTEQKSVDMRVLAVLGVMMGALVGVSIVRKKKG